CPIHSMLQMKIMEEVLLLRILGEVGREKEDAYFQNKYEVNTDKLSNITKTMTFMHDQLSSVASVGTKEGPQDTFDPNVSKKLEGRPQCEKPQPQEDSTYAGYHLAYEVKKLIIILFFKWAALVAVESMC
ncbi:hypothetical protein L9F63_008345, partial [Diploptera punctata]